MKLSAWVFLTDLIPSKRNFIDRIVKKNIFQTHSAHIAFSSLQNAGVDGIELLIPSIVAEKELFEVQHLLQKEKVRVLSLHQPLTIFAKTNIEEIKRLCTIARLFTANVLVLHLDRAKEQIFTETYCTQLHSLEKEYDLKIGFENSQKLFYLLSKSYTWKADHFSAILSQKDFHITLDTTHLAQAGGDIIKFYMENKNSIVNIHLSDYKSHLFSSTFRPTACTHLPLGQGELPVNDFLRVLKATDYKGLITMEINGTLTELCTSARKIKESIT